MEVICSSIANLSVGHSCGTSIKLLPIKAASSNLPKPTRVSAVSRRIEVFKTFSNKFPCQLSSACLISLSPA